LEQIRKASFGQLAVRGSVETVEKPRIFEFPRQKVLCFRGANFAEESFSTASLDASRIKPEEQDGHP
jgi:hypothetical protein